MDANVHYADGNVKCVFGCQAIIAVIKQAIIAVIKIVRFVHK